VKPEDSNEDLNAAQRESKAQPLENTNTAKAKDWKAKTNTKKGGGEESTHGRN
jgi:hypothetical protein